jgi:hypothetical protein
MGEEGMFENKFQNKGMLLRGARKVGKLANSLA